MKPLDYLPEEAHRSNPHGEAVVHLGPPGTDIGDLVTITGRDDQGMKYICSYWKFNNEELAQLYAALETGNEVIVELTVLAEGQPPVALNLMNGF